MVLCNTEYFKNIYKSRSFVAIIGASNEKLFMFCESLRKIFFKTIFLNICIKIYLALEKLDLMIHYSACNPSSTCLLLTCNRWRSFECGVVSKCPKFFFFQLALPNMWAYLFLFQNTVHKCVCWHRP